MSQLHSWSAGHKKRRFLLLDSQPNLKGIQRCAKVLRGYFKDSECDLSNLDDLKNIGHWGFMTRLLFVVPIVKMILSIL